MILNFSSFSLRGVLGGRFVVVPLEGGGRGGGGSRTPVTHLNIGPVGQMNTLLMLNVF